MLENKIKTIIDFIKRRYAPRGAYISFSNSGEDLLVSHALSKFGITKPNYIDIGCHHPIFGNMTYLFYTKGGRGILIEPNSSICEIIKKKRDEDICLNCGIGNNSESSDYYTFKQNTRNTFSKKQAEEWSNQSGQKYKIVRVDLISLNTIVSKYFKNKNLDLLSIDTEGYEETILLDYNWNLRPKVLFIESMGRKDTIGSILKSKGYSIFAETEANTIFIDIINNK